MSEILESLNFKYYDDTVISRLDARLKVIMVIFLLFSNVIFSNILFSIFVFINVLVLTYLSRVSLSEVVKRVKIPIVFAIFILITQGFWLKQGREIQLLGIVLYEQGIIKGVKVFLTVLSGVWLLVLISLTSKPDEVLSAFKKLGVPSVMIDVVIMMYRYMFVLKEEAIRVFYAQKVRLGYSNIRNSLRSIGELWGIMLINSIMRASRIYEAMIARGYTGKLFYESNNRIETRQIVSIVMYSVLVILVGITFKIFV